MPYPFYKTDDSRQVLSFSCFLCLVWWCGVVVQFSVISVKASRADSNESQAEESESQADSEAFPLSEF